jgi:S-(hydroxymethyl)glutathione synthase
MSTPLNIHPNLNRNAAADGFAGGKLLCNCASDKVEVTVASQSFHNHACGCTKCWKPAGALFAQIAVAPRDKVTVTANGDKLAVVDPSATILRHACTVCGTHMYGRIEKPHAFNGLDFIHTELSEEAGWTPVSFAAFVSSIIESGTRPEDMEAVRATFVELDIPHYDCLSPALMDALSTYAAKTSGVLQ